MEIKTDSWHYKLVNRFCEMDWVRNFCPYMRRLTGILAIFVFVIPSVLFGMAETLVMLVKGREVLDTWLASLGSLVLGYYGVICVILGIIAWLIVIGYLLLILVMYVVGKINNYLETNQSYTSWLRYRIKRRMARQREPNIFVLWCKARHDQICPMVKFVNSED